MLPLSKTNQLLKDDLDKIINGAYDSYLSSEQVRMALEVSFLFNHISVDLDAITFKYNGVKLRIKGIHDYIGAYTDETIIYYMRGQPEFQSALLQFKRDYKINKIL